MKVIPQSFEPIHTSPTDHIANIAAAARICYKSEGKATANETSFVRGLVKGGHNSTLEMSILHLRLVLHNKEDQSALFESKFLEPITFGNSTYCTGSIRAWREFIISRRSYKKLTDSILLYMSKHLSEVFTEDLMKYEVISTNNLYYIDQFDPEKLDGMCTSEMGIVSKQHIYQGIKFTTNRAVSHEFVRHRPCAFLQESQRYCAYSKGKFGGEVTFIEPTAFYDVDTQGYSIWYNACANAEDNYLNLLKGGDSAQAARNVLPNSCKTELIIYCSLAQWEHIFAMRDSTKADPAMREAIEPVVEWFSKEWLGSIDPNQMWNKSIG